MLQILWERGYINSEKDVRFYSVNGEKINKDSKEIIAGTSLKQIVDRLPDFKEELTLLQFCAKQLGVEICCSPKCHPEIVGKYIEFFWTFSKNNYCRCKIEDKSKVY